MATLSELYPYLRLLFARAGTLFSPVSGRVVERSTLEDVLAFLLQQPEGTEAWILRPFPLQAGENPLQKAEKLTAEGYDRFYWKGDLYEWPDFPADPDPQDLFIVVDRVFLDPAEGELRARLRESLEEVWYAHERQVWLYLEGKGEFYFSGQLYADGYTFRELTPELFNYLSSYGACPTCQGRGRSLSLYEKAVIPDPRRTLRTGLVELWELPVMAEYKACFLEATAGLIDPDQPYYAYTAQERRLLWWGDAFKGIEGIFPSFLAVLQSRRAPVTCIASRGGALPCV